MNEYINKIVKDNINLFSENSSIKKIDVGFTNSLYSVDNKYIIKICSNKNNEEKFEKEINVYIKNKDSNLIPKLYKYYVSDSDSNYSYEIIEKIEGDSLYNLWHTFNEKEREEIIKELVCIMKSIHKVKGAKYDWAKYIINKIMINFDKCLDMNIFTIEEIDQMKSDILLCAPYLESDIFSLLHADLHFDNLIYTKDKKLKLIDFETSMYAPIDYELDILLGMCNNPIKYASLEAEKYVKEKDYKNIEKYLRKYYKEIFSIHDLDLRLNIYRFENNLGLLPRFPNNKELKETTILFYNKIKKKVK